MSFKQVLKQPILRLYLALSRLWPRRFRPPPDPRDVRKILLFQFGGVGDSLRMFPLIRRLGEVFPAAEISTLTNQSARVFDLLPEGYPPCRHYLFDFSQGYLGKWRQIRALRRQRFDMLLLPVVGDGFVEIATIARLLGGACRVGFDLDGGGWSFTHSIPFERHEPLLSQYARLLGTIGVQGGPENITVRRDADAARTVADRLAGMGMAETAFVVISPWVGHQQGFKDWPPRLFRELAQRLITELGLTVILVGTASERALAAKHFGGLHPPGFRDLTGLFTLGETAELLARSGCLISNDSSLIMIAETLGVPVIAIFGATDPVQTLPLASTSRVIRTERTLSCQPCFVHHAVFDYRCPRAFECLTSIPVGRVFDAVAAAVAGPFPEMKFRTRK